MNDSDRLFAHVGPGHVAEACRQTIREGAPSRRGGRSTFVSARGHLLPAKYVLGLAYQLATGRRLSPDDYQGGEATARILRRLGVRVVRRSAGRASKAPGPRASRGQGVSEDHENDSGGRFQADERRGREVGRILHKAFTTTGIFDVTEMPEDILPKGVAKGSREHLLFITLTVAIDYQRDAHELWEAARATYEDPATRYVFVPEKLDETPQQVLVSTLRTYGLSRKHDRDAGFWRTVATSFLRKWDGDPRRLLEMCHYDAPAVLHHLVRDSHLEAGKEKRDFPSLRGPKIGPLWVRMLRDNAGLPMKKMEEVPIPVDVHIARATFSLGVLRGRLRSSFSEIIAPVQNVWAQAARGTGYLALDYDEPLWHLSKFGCSQRQGNECPRADECPVASYCIGGKVNVTGSIVELDT